MSYDATCIAIDEARAQPTSFLKKLTTAEHMEAKTLPIELFFIELISR
jgi:hypothetical protein